jgi:hypothetical protein
MRHFERVRNARHRYPVAYRPPLAPRSLQPAGPHRKVTTVTHPEDRVNAHEFLGDVAELFHRRFGGRWTRWASPSRVCFGSYVTFCGCERGHLVPSALVEDEMLAAIDEFGDRVEVPGMGGCFDDHV